MYISNNVIIGKKIRNKAPDILTFLLKLHDASFDSGDNEDLKKGKRSGVGHTCFLITTTPFDNQVMYIMSGAELLRRNMDVDQVRILGIAGSRGEAREIVRMIMEDVAADGALNQVRDYLEKY